MRPGLPTLAATALLATLLGAGPATAQIREGVYALEGTNPDGSRYSGGFSLQETPNAGWYASWLVDGVRIPGLALVQGGVLSVAYVVQGRPGIAAYEVQADGTLRGSWTVGGGIGTEELTPR